MTRYVLGFLFAEDYETVLLILKNKPKWQAGLLNGLGGKIEDDESAAEAMVREFKEEAGVITNGWREFCRMTGKDFAVHCYALLDDGAFLTANSQESEILLRVASSRVYARECVSNVPWLVEMARDKNPGSTPFCAHVAYGSKPSDAIDLLSRAHQCLMHTEYSSTLGDEIGEYLSLRIAP